MWISAVFIGCSFSHTVLPLDSATTSISFLGFGLDNLGQDFQVVIVAFVGDLESNNLLLSFGDPGKLLVDKARKLTGLGRKTGEVLVEVRHSTAHVLRDFSVCDIELLSQGFESFF